MAGSSRQPFRLPPCPISEEGICSHGRYVMTCNRLKKHMKQANKWLLLAAEHERELSETDVAALGRSVLMLMEIQDKMDEDDVGTKRQTRDYSTPQGERTKRRSEAVSPLGLNLNDYTADAVMEEAQRLGVEGIDDEEMRVPSEMGASPARSPVGAAAAAVGEGQEAAGAGFEGGGGLPPSPEWRHADEPPPRLVDANEDPLFWNLPAAKRAVLQAAATAMGYDVLREPQFAWAAALFEGYDVFVEAPTGAGKSAPPEVIYKLLESKRGTVVLVCPTRFIIQGYMARYDALGIDYQVIVGGDRRGMPPLRLPDMTNGRSRMLIFTLEKLIYELESTYSRIRPVLDSLYADGRLCVWSVDEVHLVRSDEDFRPDFKKLGMLRTRYPDTIIYGATATATAVTRNVVAERLLFEGARHFRSSVDRPNIVLKDLSQRNPPRDLSLMLEAKANDVVQALRDDGLLRPLGEGSVLKEGILCFAPTKPYAREFQGLLEAACAAQGIAAAPGATLIFIVHGELTNYQKAWVFAEFNAGRIHIIIATPALALGVNLRARAVFCLAGALTFEAMVQMIGRVGRNLVEGDNAFAYITMEPADFEVCADLLRYGSLEKFAERMTELCHVWDFVHRKDGCMNAGICRYFGEEGTPCGPETLFPCGNCAAAADVHDTGVTEVGQRALYLVGKYPGLTIPAVVALCRGLESNTVAGKRVSDKDRLNGVGIRQQWRAPHVRAVVHRLIATGAVVQRPQQEWYRVENKWYERKWYSLAPSGFSEAELLARGAFKVFTFGEWEVGPAGVGGVEEDEEEMGEEAMAAGGGGAATGGGGRGLAAVGGGGAGGAGAGAFEGGVAALRGVARGLTAAAARGAGEDPTVAMEKAKEAAIRAVPKGSLPRALTMWNMLDQLEVPFQIHTGLDHQLLPPEGRKYLVVSLVNGNLSLGGFVDAEVPGTSALQRRRMLPALQVGVALVDGHVRAGKGGADFQLDIDRALKDVLGKSVGLPQEAREDRRAFSAALTARLRAVVAGPARVVGAA